MPPSPILISANLVFYLNRQATPYKRQPNSHPPSFTHCDYPLKTQRPYFLVLYFIFFLKITASFCWRLNHRTACNNENKRKMLCITLIPLLKTIHCKKGLPPWRRFRKFTPSPCEENIGLTYSSMLFKIKCLHYLESFLH